MTANRRKIIFQNALRDPEFWFIIGYNTIVIYLYLNNSYDKNIAIWGYYLQSVFIGAQFVLISMLKTVKATGSFFPLKKHVLSGFFTIHYGLFHFVYLIFLILMISKGSGQNYEAFVQFIQVTVMYLIANTLFLSGRELLPNTPDYPTPSIIGAYVRIIPMHILIIVAWFQNDSITYAFMLFMGLKIFFDLLIYIISLTLSIDDSKT